VDDHLLPDSTAEAVGEVVDLVHDDVSEARQGRRPAYSMLRSTSVVMTTTGASPLTEESPVSSPTRSAPCRADEIVVLLVRQGLDRRRVEALAARWQGQVDGELADDGLAGTGRCRDQDPA
jgi:hypothetical protein